MFLGVRDQHMSYISDDLFNALLETHGMFESDSNFILKCFLKVIFFKKNIKLIIF